MSAPLHLLLAWFWIVFAGVAIFNPGMRPFTLTLIAIGNIHLAAASILRRMDRP